MDAALADKDWLVGDYSLADMAWAPNAHSLNLMKYPFERHPNVQAWYERFKQRLAYQERMMSLEPPPAAEASAG